MSELLAQNRNLNHLVETSFQEANRLFVLAFENDARRTSNDIYYLLNVEIKDHNVMIDGFFEYQIKNNKTTSYRNLIIEKIILGKLLLAKAMMKQLDYTYFRDIYKMIAIDLSKQ